MFQPLGFAGVSPPGSVVGSLAWEGGSLPRSGVPCIYPFFFFTTTTRNHS
ncbi:hypothetical protein Hanom_Chr14g01260881 [Helianthus anomalus]